MVINFLTNLVGDVYKILPMKEEEIKGAKNHLPEYVKRTIINKARAIAPKQRINFRLF